MSSHSAHDAATQASAFARPHNVVSLDELRQERERRINLIAEHHFMSDRALDAFQQQHGAIIEALECEIERRECEHQRRVLAAAGINNPDDDDNDDDDGEPYRIDWDALDERLRRGSEPPPPTEKDFSAETFFTP